ncbi:hypothetical protein IFM89_018124 [Coptis chinensis]|uniref:Uncharacterized protein n=1 Tax=Coptis chinensis TaxID=261450 RepID=A0A835HYL2_9MAGN|nr:hypothetical protein IFM89_018124 [Coptis chinensis]
MGCLRTKVHLAAAQLCAFCLHQLSYWIFSTICAAGMRKAYWLTCNVEPDIQHLSLDRRKFPSSFVVRPRDLNRLLANFQSSLQEITVIATEQNSMPTDASNEIGGKAVELRSYIDPTKDASETALHTQLWIDPTEEFLQYTHTGDPVDVTFAVKELKPILMTPKFDLDDGANSDFDVTLVLATMLVSQLQEGIPLEHPVAGARTDNRRDSQAQQDRSRAAMSENPSDQTRIWSELSGSALRSGSGAEERNFQGNANASEQSGLQRVNTTSVPMAGPARGNILDVPDIQVMAVENFMSKTCC